MTPRLKSAIVLGVVLCFCLTTNATAADQTASIVFKVKVPPGTPTDAKLYLAGSDKALGGAEWKADGFHLTRGDDGVYTGTVDLPKDKQVEYKVTRGSWETVEKNGDGSEMNNRTLTPTKDSTVEIEVKRWADADGAGKPAPPAEKKSTRSGDIRVHAKFDSRILGNERDILVYLPSAEGRDKGRRFPVLYLQDGQNVFDAATSFSGEEWRADETATRLILEKKIEPLIIVAIANTKHRMDEYTLDRDETHHAGGGGRDYMRFVVEEVKPFIDKTYPTRPGRNSTAVGGSSLGAVISLEICSHYPDHFGNCLAMSPALGWADYALLKRMQRDHDWVKDCRFWIDVGTAEGSTPANYNAMLGGLLLLESRLIKSGARKGLDYDLIVVKDGKHNEQAWADRLDKALMFLFPPEPVTRPSYNPGNGHPTPTSAPDPAAPRDVAAG